MTKRTLEVEYEYPIVEIKGGPVGKDVKVLVNGYDIGQHCNSIRVDASPGELVTVTVGIIAARVDIVGEIAPNALIFEVVPEGEKDFDKRVADSIIRNTRRDGSIRSVLRSTT